MTKTVIIENLEIWEAQIITAAEELFSPEEIEEYIEIRNVLKNKLVEKSGYDRRLNLAYGIYLIKQTHEVLKKSSTAITTIKSGLQESGIYCPNIDLAIGLKVQSDLWNLKRQPKESVYSYRVNLSSEYFKNKYWDTKRPEYFEAIQHAIAASNPDAPKDNSLFFSIEKIAWIENNQILANTIDFRKIYDDSFSKKKKPLRSRISTV